MPAANLAEAFRAVKRRRSRYVCDGLLSSIDPVRVLFPPFRIATRAGHAVLRLQEDVDALGRRKFGRHRRDADCRSQLVWHSSNDSTTTRYMPPRLQFMPDLNSSAARLAMMLRTSFL